jgi:GntR family transcriptional regulator
LRLWFSTASEVPIYRQLVTQVVLAILSGDLKPGDRLPSTRELARRFSIHPNTVSAGYRQLAKDKWVEYRRGSGVYIKNNAKPSSTPEQILDQHIAAFFRAVRELRLPSAAIRQRVAEWIASPPPDRCAEVCFCACGRPRRHDARCGLGSVSRRSSRRRRPRRHRKRRRIGPA